jgi:hypothetical protein
MKATQEPTHPQTPTQFNISKPKKMSKPETTKDRGLILGAMKIFTQNFLKNLLSPTQTSNLTKISRQILSKSCPTYQNNINVQKLVLQLTSTIIKMTFTHIHLMLTALNCCTILKKNTGKIEYQTIIMNYITHQLTPLFA